MKTSFRVLENVPDHALNLGYIDSPTITPSNSIVSYDYSGNHVDNVSSFPDRTRLISSTYDKDHNSWYMRSMYATDCLITNRILARRGIKRTVPLYFSFTTDFPLISDFANYNGSNIEGAQYLINEYSLTTSSGIPIKHDAFLHDVEFIPYNVYFNEAYSADNSNLFFIRVFSNGTPNRSTLKIKYKALITRANTPTLAEGHSEYLSFERLFNLFNINYDFPNGIGSDLFGHAYEFSKFNPFFSSSSGAIPIDPDKSKGRDHNEYSLLHNASENNYVGMLTDKTEDVRYKNKPAPMMIIYYEGVKENIVGENYINIAITPTEIVLHLIDPGQPSKVYTFSLKNRTSYDVVYEINSSPVPFTAYEGVRVEAITEQTLYLDSASLYGSGDTSLLFDLSADGGILVRSTKFISKYTAVPTIQALPPVNKSSRVPWNPRIKLGGFIADNGLVYYVNEYSSQRWSTRYKFPYLDVIGEESKFLSPTIISTSYKRLFNDTGSLTISDENGDNLNVYIDGMDAMQGLIYLNKRIKSTKIFISYSYRETSFEASNINLNPAEPHNAEVGKFYVVLLKPYIIRGTVNSSTVYSIITDEFPDGNYIGADLILSVFHLTNKFTLADYNIRTTSKGGGGLNPNLTLQHLKTKVSNLDSYFDYGHLDGKRFPANSVVHYALPRMLAGDETVILAPYDNTATNNTIIKVFGAAKIPPGTTVNVWYSQIGLPPEQAVIKGIIDHETVRLYNPLTTSVQLGAKITFPINIDPLFTMAEIEEVINQFNSAGSTPIIEFQ